MKRLARTSLAFMALIAMMLISSCSKMPKTAKLIPDDAAVVVRIDAKTALESSGVASDDESKNKIKQILQKNEFKSAEFKEAVLDIIDNPANLGLDLRDPLFFYVADDGNDFALVGTVYSKDDFSSFLNKLSKEEECDKVKDNGDFNSFVNRRNILVFNDDAFIFSERSSDADEADFINKLKAKLDTNDAKGTMAESEYMNDLCKAEGFTQVLVNIKGLASHNKLNEALKMMPADMDIEKLAYMVCLGVDKDNIFMTCEALTQDEKMKEYFQQSASHIQAIPENLLQYATEEDAAMYLNFDLQAALKDNNIMDNLLKVLPDGEQKKTAQQVLSAIQGEGVFTFSDLNLEARVPTFSLYIKTKDDSFMSFFDQQFSKPGSGIESVGKYQYRIPISSSAYASFGLKDSQFYAVAGENAKPFQAKSSPFPSSRIKGKGMYCYLPASLLIKILNNIEISAVKSALDVIKLFEYAEGYYENGVKFVFNIHAKESSQGIIPTLFSALSKMAENFTPQSIDYEDVVVEDTNYVSEEDLAYEDTAIVDTIEW